MFKNGVGESRGSILKSFLRSKTGPYRGVYAIGGKLYNSDFFLVLNRVFHRFQNYPKKSEKVVDEHKGEVLT